MVSRELPCSSKEITSLFVGYPESDMRVKRELLVPGVQYAEETDLRTEGGAGTPLQICIAPALRAGAPGRGATVAARVS